MLKVRNISRATTTILPIRRGTPISICTRTTAKAKINEKKNNNSNNADYDNYNDNKINLKK